MSGKKAKALRQMAREAVGDTVRSRLRNRKTGQIVNDPNSTRGMTRKLKKMAKVGAKQ